jgi:glutamate formiminotransferase
VSGLLELVPNVSNGRDAVAVRAIADAFASAGATLLGVESDADHHRSVVTLAGTREEVVEGAVRGVIASRDRIDLNRQRGAHPRMGAADVVPFVPLAGATMADAVHAATEAAERIAAEAGVPTYLYGEAARRLERRDLAAVRKGEFEGLREAALSDPDRRPDFGGPALHPTAGASAVGARFFLIAYNVNLDSRDLDLAKRIAKEVRERDGGLPAVKALGFDLPDRRWVQVSMNLTDYRKTPPLRAFEEVARRAEQAGVRVAGSEVVGLIPEAAMEGGLLERARVLDFGDEQVLERRLAARRSAK